MIGKRNTTRKSGFSLTVTLATSIGLLVTIGVGSVILYLRQESHRAVVQSVVDRAELTADLIIDAIDETMRPAEDQAAFVAGLVDDGTIDLDDSDSIEQSLIGALAPAPHILAVGIITETLWHEAYQVPEMSALYEADGGLLHGVETYDTTESSALRAAVNDTVRVGPPRWESVSYDIDHQLAYLAYIAPFSDPAGRMGAVYSLVAVLDLSLRLAEISERLDSTAFVLDADDRVVAHPDLLADRWPLSQDDPMIGLAELGDPVLAGYRGAPADPGIPTHLLADRGLRVLNDVRQERPDTYILTEIAGYDSRPWTVGSHFPAFMLTGGLKRIDDSAYIGLAMLAAALLAGIVLARRVSKPIKRLAANATKIGALDLSQVERLPGSRITELNDQATAFNAMVDGLKWFELYMPKTLVRRLIGRGEDEGIRSETRALSVMFTDLSGFTGQSETMAAEDVAAMLNHHFALLGAAVEAEDGTIDKFIGDALMAFWGAPQDQPDHADRAVRAGIAMADAIARDNDDRRTRGLAPLRVRIGIHSGPVIVGNIGAPGRMNYTVVGDAVNIAQRLESLSKELTPDAEVSLLVSEATRAALTTAIAMEPAGAFQVKGRSEPISVLRPLLGGSR